VPAAGAQPDRVVALAVQRVGGDDDVVQRSGRVARAAVNAAISSPAATVVWVSTSW
jgi:hypothetical protein